LDCTLARAGFHPRGGGLLHVNIVPSRHHAPLHLTERGNPAPRRLPVSS